jgi:hypothetical protein
MGISLNRQYLHHSTVVSGNNLELFPVEKLGFSQGQKKPEVARRHNNAGT